MRYIETPVELKHYSIKELNALAQEIREEIIKTVSQNGGHLASNLGTVELTIALHYVFDAPRDRIVFDVGHQAYTHKLLTGRLEGFERLRKADGVSGFPDSKESEFDAFTAGHASTAISAALGIARARDIRKDNYNVVAVLGDGALTGGMCYEALNDAGQSKTPMVVILNDNEMSISRNVGAMSNYLTRLRQSKTYSAVKRGVRRGLSAIPVIGIPLFRVIEKAKNVIKSALIDGKFFDALGFDYIGPINGHDLKHLIRILNRCKHLDRPVIVHVVTQKGKGYAPAENHPDTYHGVVPFLIESGESVNPSGEMDTAGAAACATLVEIADEVTDICVVTAAMQTGTGMQRFQERFPDHFFDVGIAEEHAVEMAAGLAANGLRPYVAIYSTFMQRAYDQILMDVCRNHLPVVFLLDRAGLVGADGATHQGVYDLSYLRMMPNMIVSAPRDQHDLMRLIHLSEETGKPFAIRYPKKLEKCLIGSPSAEKLRVGQWELLFDGSDAMILTAGRMVQIALQAAAMLERKELHVGVIDARFIKPIDIELLERATEGGRPIITLEDNVLAGGFGEMVLNALSEQRQQTKVLTLGVPDRFVKHGSVFEQLKACRLDSDSIATRIQEWLARFGSRA